MSNTCTSRLRSTYANMPPLIYLSIGFWQFILCVALAVDIIGRLKRVEMLTCFLALCLNTGEGMATL